MVKTKNYVLKRNGRKEEVHFDKITSRIQKLCYGLNMDYIDPVSITLKVISGLYPGVTTAELDNLAAETAVVMTSQHPDYAKLAARIAVSNLHKETKKHFSDVIEDLYKATNNKTGRKAQIISDEHYTIIMKNASRLNSCIIYDRDFSYDYFAFKLLERTCLLKINGKIAERPQHMLMRVAVGIHGEDIDSAIETYKHMSEKFFIHDPATLLSAATTEPDLISSYLITMPDDSLDGIYDCIMQCAKVGDIEAEVGVSVQIIRAKGTEIAGTNGVSNGLVPMLRVFNNSACYVSQNDNVESQAIYLEPWHPDIMDFLNLRKGAGKDEYRARDLMYALWIPDLFMKRVKNDEKWSLMCPHRSQNLPNTWSEDFEKLYEKYEVEGNFVKQMSARDLWRAICVSQMETGGPYILYKDACNKKSNQKNLGTIKNASFCTSIVEYTSPEEIGTCASASVAVNKFINADKTGYDFVKLKEVVKVVTKNLDKIIDVTSYPLPQAKESNMRHRPIGISVQGLADTFVQLRVPFDSQEARKLNREIFETIYYAALEASSEIAEKNGTYSTYKDSPISNGVLQYDMWDVTPSQLWDWTLLKEKIAKHGVRNSLLVAVTPTTSSSQILANSRSIEPYISNVYVGRVPSGEFQVINRHLLKDLIEKDLWNDTIKDQIIDNDGSIQNISSIPDDLKKIYRTVWEISQKAIIDMAADRGAFVDQSQAMNIYIPSPNYGMMSSMHFYGWQKGLKTGMYVLKTKPRSNNSYAKGERIGVTVKQENGVENGNKSAEEAALVCSLQNPGACEMCSA